MNEVWKQIDGFPDYWISNLGRVESMVNPSNPKILKQTIGSHGYPMVSLWGGKKRKGCTVHRLIAKAFIPNPQEKPFINHIDSVRSNNSIDNLEWCTQSENLRHAGDKGRMGKRDKRGEKHPRVKLTESQVLEIREMCKVRTRGDLGRAAKIYGVGSTTIGEIVYRHIWKHI